MYRCVIVYTNLSFLSKYITNIFYQEQAELEEQKQLAEQQQKLAEQQEFLAKKMMEFEAVEQKSEDNAAKTLEDMIAYDSDVENTKTNDLDDSEVVEGIFPDRNLDTEYKTSDAQGLEDPNLFKGKKLR